MGTRAGSDQHYRPLAVTVDVRSDGFRWRLLESENGGDGWQVLSTAHASVKRYRDAMSAGLLALQALTDDLDAGPQREATSEDSEDPSTDGEDHPPRRKGSVFGFGPVQ